jgi:nucleotide-binding universal stress UspA family protein
MRAQCEWRSIHTRVSASLIISYDGTPNDDDALALGRLLAWEGVELALAYVRHAPEFDPAREEIAQHDAERRLESGAGLLGDPAIPRHVLFSAATGKGLQELADAEGAQMIVFGSDYRTPPGHAEPPTSAQRLLEVGGVGIAVAAAGLRAQPDARLESVSAISDGSDDTAAQTAQALATKLGAKVVAPDGTAADLIVVGSQPGAPAGRIALSGAARTMLDASRGSVLVLPSGRPLRL